MVTSAFRADIVNFVLHHIDVYSQVYLKGRSSKLPAVSEHCVLTTCDSFGRRCPFRLSWQHILQGLATSGAY